MRMVAAGATMIMLGGCSTQMDELLSLEAGRSPTAVMKYCLSEAQKEDKTSEELNNLNSKRSEQWKKANAQTQDALFDTWKKEDSKRDLNWFLDCIFGISVDQDDLETRLVRGHAIVGILAIYGAWTSQFDLANQKDDATRILSRIEKASRLMWEASNYEAKITSLAGSPAVPRTAVVAVPIGAAAVPAGGIQTKTKQTTVTYNTVTDAFKQQKDRIKKWSDLRILEKALRKNASPLPTAAPLATDIVLNAEPGRIKRIIAVTQVVTAVSKPVARRARLLLTKVFSLITSGTPTPSSLLSTAKAIRGTIKRATTTHIYGTAYFTAVKDFLLNVKARPNRFPSLQDWKEVDKKWLKPACDLLATFAGRENKKHTCVPESRELI